jgi:hypothetical protein
MHKFNNHFPDDATEDSLVNDRLEMLTGIMGKVGKNVFIEPPINIDYGCNIIIGDDFYSNFKWVPVHIFFFIFPGTVRYCFPRTPDRKACS